MIQNLKHQIHGVLLGLKDFSVTYETEYTIEEIKEITQELKGKEVFVSINKNIENNELKALHQVLDELSKIHIAGILFYDLAILNRKNKIKANLWWAQEHFTTNYLTAQYYEREGVGGTYLSSDITKKDLEEIRKQTSMPLMINAFGYMPIFVSKRKAIENYKKTFELQNKKETYYIEKEGKKYPITETKKATCVYTPCVLNIAEEIPFFKEKGFEYIVCNSFQIEEKTFEKIISLYASITEENKTEVQKQVHDICSQNTDKAFLYKNTIVKVK